MTKNARALLFALPILAACHHDPTDAAGVRANLTAAGFAVTSAGAPDPRAAGTPGVISTECFDATSGATVHVCVWIWSGGHLPETFPLESFTQDNDVYTESRNAVLLVVGPTGGEGDQTPAYRALRAAWGD